MIQILRYGEVDNDKIFARTEATVNGQVGMVPASNLFFIAGVLSILTLIPMVYAVRLKKAEKSPLLSAKVTLIKKTTRKTRSKIPIMFPVLWVGPKMMPLQN